MPDRNIVVLAAPSGAGKTTIAHRVMEAMVVLPAPLGAVRTTILRSGMVR